MNQHVSVPDTSGILASRALILTLHISQWSGRRLDRDVTSEINDAKNAQADAGRYNKALLPKQALAAVAKIASETRNGFIDRTLPWTDKGSRIMAADAYLPFTQWVSGQSAKYAQAVSDFLFDYPTYVHDAHKRLGDMFDVDDYPTADQLRGKFVMETDVLPVPTGDDFRVSMSAEQAELIRADIERRVKETTQEAVSDIYRRVADVSGRMAERLTAFRPSKGKGDKAEGVFRDSLVENIRDLVGVLPALNITGDPQLDALVDELRPLVEHDASVLRENECVRADVAAEAQAIVDRVSQFL